MITKNMIKKYFDYQIRSAFICLVVRFFRIDPTVSGSNLPSAKLPLRVRRVVSALRNSRCRNDEVWSHREGGPGHCLISFSTSKVYYRMLRTNHKRKETLASTFCGRLWNQCKTISKELNWCSTSQLLFRSIIIQ